ncbi:hypothetical protein E2C01_014205 [Portunus trituberculatus]|uniref:Uncharacterized protein n=1 Tax=Portunus trituberculatus TaxID=210409 RepID=A0A5B7DJI2_PORTR|nr:hypothetical protein [Portunus trituberculatus]
MNKRAAPRHSDSRKPLTSISIRRSSFASMSCTRLREADVIRVRTSSTSFCACGYCNTILDVSPEPKFLTSSSLLDMAGWVSIVRSARGHLTPGLASHLSLSTAGQSGAFT